MPSSARGSSHMSSTAGTSAVAAPAASSSSTSRWQQASRTARTVLKEIGHLHASAAQGGAGAAMPAGARPVRARGAPARPASPAVGAASSCTPRHRPASPPPSRVLSAAPQHLAHPTRASTSVRAVGTGSQGAAQQRDGHTSAGAASSSWSSAVERPNRSQSSQEQESACGLTNFNESSGARAAVVTHSSASTGSGSGSGGGNKISRNKARIPNSALSLNKPTTTTKKRAELLVQQHHLQRTPMASQPPQEQHAGCSQQDRDDVEMSDPLRRYPSIRRIRAPSSEQLHTPCQQHHSSHTSNSMHVLSAHQTPCAGPPGGSGGSQSHLLFSGKMVRNLPPGVTNQTPDSTAVNRMLNRRTYSTDIDAEDDDDDQLRKHFKNVVVVGKGNFSTVYKATHRIDGCDYAIKKLRARLPENWSSATPSSSSTSRNKKHGRGHQQQHQATPVSLQEAQNLAQALFRVENAHIVRYYSCWVQQRRLYIQTELCQTSLSEVIEAKRRGAAGACGRAGRAGSGFTERELLEVMRAVLQGLETMHGKAMIHLDIKPDNVLRSFSGHYKIADLGLATFAINSASATTAASAEGEGHQHQRQKQAAEFSEGDCRYLCRELLKAGGTTSSSSSSSAQHQVDLDLTKADIFSLGAMCYELGSGKDLAAAGESWHALRDLDVDFEGEMPQLSEDCVSLIVAMLQPDAAKRPSACAGLRAVQELEMRAASPCSSSCSSQIDSTILPASRKNTSELKCGSAVVPDHENDARTSCTSGMHMPVDADAVQKNVATNSMNMMEVDQECSSASASRDVASSAMGRDRPSPRDWSSSNQDHVDSRIKSLEATAEAWKREALYLRKQNEELRMKLGLAPSSNGTGCDLQQAVNQRDMMMLEEQMCPLTLSRVSTACGAAGDRSDDHDQTTSSAATGCATEPCFQHLSSPKNRNATPRAFSTNAIGNTTSSSCSMQVIDEQSNHSDSGGRDTGLIEHRTAMIDDLVVPSAAGAAPITSIAPATKRKNTSRSSTSASAFFAVPRGAPPGKQLQQKKTDLLQEQQKVEQAEDELLFQASDHEGDFELEPPPAPEDDTTSARLVSSPKKGPARYLREAIENSANVIQRRNLTGVFDGTRSGGHGQHDHDVVLLRPAGREEAEKVELQECQRRVHGPDDRGADHADRMSTGSSLIGVGRKLRRNLDLDRHSLANSLASSSGEHHPGPYLRGKQHSFPSSASRGLAGGGKKSSYSRRDSMPEVGSGGRLAPSCPFSSDEKGVGHRRKKLMGESVFSSGSAGPLHRVFSAPNSGDKHATGAAPGGALPSPPPLGSPLGGQGLLCGGAEESMPMAMQIEEDEVVVNRHRAAAHKDEGIASSSCTTDIAGQAVAGTSKNRCPPPPPKGHCTTTSTSSCIATSASASAPASAAKRSHIREDDRRVDDREMQDRLQDETMVVKPPPICSPKSKPAPASRGQGRKYAQSASPVSSFVFSQDQEHPDPADREGQEEDAGTRKKRDGGGGRGGGSVSSLALPVVTFGAGTMLFSSAAGVQGSTTCPHSSCSSTAARSASAAPPLASATRPATSAASSGASSTSCRTTATGNKGKGKATTPSSTSAARNQQVKNPAPPPSRRGGNKLSSPKNATSYPAATYNSKTASLKKTKKTSSDKKSAQLNLSADLRNRRKSQVLGGAAGSGASTGTHHVAGPGPGVKKKSEKKAGSAGAAAAVAAANANLVAAKANTKKNNLNLHVDLVNNQVVDHAAITQPTAESSCTSTSMSPLHQLGPPTSRHLNLDATGKTNTSTTSSSSSSSSSAFPFQNSEALPRSTGSELGESSRFLDLRDSEKLSSCSSSCSPSSVVSSFGVGDPGQDQHHFASPEMVMSCAGVGVGAVTDEELSMVGGGRGAVDSSDFAAQAINIESPDLGEQEHASSAASTTSSGGDHRHLRRQMSQGENEKRPSKRTKLLVERPSVLADEVGQAPPDVSSSALHSDGGRTTVRSKNDTRSSPRNNNAGAPVMTRAASSKDLPLSQSQMNGNVRYNHSTSPTGIMAMNMGGGGPGPPPQHHQGTSGATVASSKRSKGGAKRK